MNQSKMQSKAKPLPGSKKATNKEINNLVAEALLIKAMRRNQQKLRDQEAQKK